MITVYQDVGSRLHNEHFISIEELEAFLEKPGVQQSIMEDVDWGTSVNVIAVNWKTRETRFYTVLQYTEVRVY